MTYYGSYLATMQIPSYEYNGEYFLPFKEILKAYKTTIKSVI